MVSHGFLADPMHWRNPCLHSCSDNCQISILKDFFAATTFWGTQFHTNLKIFENIKKVTHMFLWNAMLDSNFFDPQIVSNLFVNLSHLKFMACCYTLSTLFLIHKSVISSLPHFWSTDAQYHVNTSHLKHNLHLAMNFNWRDTFINQKTITIF